LPLLLLIFWLIRVRFKNAYTRTALPDRTREDRMAVPRAITAWMSKVG
jgi:hypothetical protein